jgi:anion-transporting  ArsA/GET3 family ATPase
MLLEAHGLRLRSLSEAQDEIVDKLDEHAEALNKVWKGMRRNQTPKGSKTPERISRMKEILSNGARTFKEMEKLLGVSPKEMNRLVSKVDQRSFEVFTRPGDERQKVIKLRSLTSNVK